MPRYSEEIIQQVIEANDIVDIISTYVQLKKSGHSFMGRCPFHNERTPSFSVSPDKQLYHCFGCGASGNVISFVMDIENMTFPEALEWLAERANITLPRNSEYTDLQYQQKKRYYEINRRLANYYYLLLKHSSKGKSYLNKRGLNPSTVKTFGIGYSKDSWNNAYRFLSKQKVTSEEMLAIGLIAKGKNGRLYDRFRDRLMIPIQNSRDQIIGFGGRIMSNDRNAPKYLNSPESIIFSKGYELFNLNRAKKNIQDNQFILVEGYMDVIALFQYGIKNVVAALGTAFTEHHVKLLERYVNSVVLCFDGDQAGEKATLRAIEILKKSDLEIKVLRLNIEDDPDSFIRKNGSDAFLEKIKDSKTVTDYLLDNLLKNNSLKTHEDRIRYVNEAIPILQNTRNDMEKDFYSKVVSKRTGISATIIYNEVKKNKKPSVVLNHQSNELTSSSKIPLALEQAEKNIIVGLLKGNINISSCLKNQLYFSDPFYKKIYGFIEKKPDIVISTIVSLLEPNEAQRLSNLLNNDDEQEDINYTESMQLLNKKWKEEKISQLTNKLKQDPSNPNVIEIMRQIQILKTELSTGGENGNK
ncbi:DNA primase [Pseudoramibacter sp.]|jgi:DNA primase|uniref:DNA primase n=1 Tax=Pseudoramibacter sp. TaxID=2034862 RepID=UPI0025FD22CB|nr:DNA primase [Pseudoramibacter sp.]MCH4072826.1 DNA primase [Pseudoramibacter sp.]MCH4106597.1 DNA primase [Pseudoramibacter sp.]